MKTSSRKNWLTEFCLYALLAAGFCPIVWAFLNFTAFGVDVNSLMLLSVGILLVVASFGSRRYRRDAVSERKRADSAEWELREFRHYLSGAEKSNEMLRQAYETSRTPNREKLTELPDRRYVLKEISESLNNQSNNRFAVLLLNLNRFRMINDTLGQGTGDRIIRQVAKRICETIGTNDVAGHFGGDEFAVIVAELKDPSAAIRMADRLAHRIAESVRFKQREVYTTAGIGIVLGCSDYTRPEDLLRDAEIAMHNAKESGKNWVVFDQTMYTRAVDQQQLETDLRYAIVCNELELFYQPIVRLDDGKLCGFESLVRWNHPRKGLMSPSEFIPLAESTGLITPMTVQILKNACDKLVEWQDLFAPLMLSVNLSARNFSDAQLVDQLETIVRESGIRPASLKLEITETALMKNAAETIELLKRLRALGVSISVDDFGTGYSSLSFLHTFPLDHLKIDRSFVETMGNGNQNRQIVRTIIALAKTLSLEIIAEGIETKEQFRKLRRLGCQYGQGYLFSRPLPVGEIETMLQDKISWAHLLPSGHLASRYDGEPIQLETTQ